jgi:hypothetical protein
MNADKRRFGFGESSAFIGGQELRVRLAQMPEISSFFGIIVAMYRNDRAPPLFHVRYGRQNGEVH